MTFAERRTVTVLLVEDAPETRHVLTELLEMQGLRVVAASTAEEALAAGTRARSDSIDLLLADLHLPDGDGGQVASSLKARHPHMRSLFLSGASAPKLDPGQAFLRKPAGFATILGQIHALLPQSA
jgi:two-component system, cell cycle sensor histidine kinase and response regulator CckA